MILNNISTTETNCNIEGNVFKVAATPITFEILSSRLYANPKLAVVRELITNAYDSHKLAGKLDTPISVTFPDYKNNNFIIRDFGTGLCKEDVLELYTTFFSSTKSNSNDFTGCFGLGSKTPFSYTSTFAINSYYNGIKYFFTAVKKDGYPHIYCINEIPTEEPNGLEIIIPAGNDGDLYVEAYNYLKYIPEILIDSNKDLVKGELLSVVDNIFIYKKVRYYYTSNDNELYIKQGQNIYLSPVPIRNKILNQILAKTVVVLEAPIGTFSITPSRESLSKDQDNISKLTDYIESTIQKFNHLVNTKSSLLEDIDKDLYVNLVFNKYFGEDTSCIRLISNLSTNKNYVNLMFNDSFTRLLTTDTIGNKIKSLTIFKDKPIYIVVTPDKHFKKHHIKLKNIIKNYELGHIYVLTPYEYESFKSVYKTIKNAVFILNEMNEINFDIRLFNINQFIKEFPNYKRKTSYTKHNIDYSQRVISYYSINFLLENYSQKSHNSISHIQNTFNSNNTIILEGKNYNSSLINLITTFIKKIRDENDNNFLFNYFNKNKKLDEQLFKNILVIPKSYLKYFKDYNIINEYELLSFVKTTEYIAYYTDESSNPLFAIHYYMTLYNTLNINFRKKTLEYVKNSRLYKYLHKYVTNKKLVKVYQNRILSERESNMLINFFKIDRRKFKKVNLKSLVLRDYKKLQKLVSRDESTMFNKFLKVDYFKLSNTKKLKILKYIRGEDNVIFFK